MVLAPRSTRGFQKKGDLHDALTPALTRKMVIESCSVGEMGALGQVGAVQAAVDCACLSSDTLGVR